MSRVALLAARQAAEAEARTVLADVTRDRMVALGSALDAAAQAIREVLAGDTAVAGTLLSKAAVASVAAFPPYSREAESLQVILWAIADAAGRRAVA